MVKHIYLLSARTWYVLPKANILDACSVIYNLATFVHEILSDSWSNNEQLTENRMVINSSSKCWFNINLLLVKPDIAAA